MKSTPHAGPSRGIPDVPMGDAVRRDPTVPATQICPDRRRWMSNIAASSVIDLLSHPPDDEGVSFRGPQASLLLTPIPDMPCSVIPNLRGVLAGHSELQRCSVDDALAAGTFFGCGE